MKKVKYSALLICLLGLVSSAPTKLRGAEQRVPTKELQQQPPTARHLIGVKNKDGKAYYSPSPAPKPVYVDEIVTDILPRSLTSDKGEEAFIDGDSSYNQQSTSDKNIEESQNNDKGIFAWIKRVVSSTLSSVISATGSYLCVGTVGGKCESFVTQAPSTRPRKIYILLE